jgi:hypothetical protein
LNKEKQMENRRVQPPLYVEKAIHPEKAAEHARDIAQTSREEAIRQGAVKDPDDLESSETRFVTRRAREARRLKKEKSMSRPYTMDEITTAQLLKGHPRAEEIVDTLFKSNKKTEGGDEFQDGSEDSIGSEGHAPPGRPGTIKHEGGNAVPGPDHPGTAVKNASEDDFDLEKAIDIVGNFLLEKGYELDEINEIIDDYFGLEKSGVERGTLTDNEPEKFKEGIEEDDTIPEGDEGETAEEAQTGKSFTADEATLEFLRKSMGQERFEDYIKAMIPKYGTPGALSSKVNMPSEEEKAKNPLINRKADPEKVKALTQSLKASAEKSEGEDADLEKSEEEELEKGGKHRDSQTQERAEWAKDPEEEKREHMKKKSEEPEEFSLDYNEDVLKAMGLYKGSPSVSKKVSGGKATQIAYGSEHGVGTAGKPETRYTHPKGKTEKRYRFEPKKGEVTVRERAKGDKGAEWKERKIGAGEEEKLKNASTSSLDLHKSLDEILAKHRG